jgi:hypothetical protein
VTLRQTWGNTWLERRSLFVADELLEYDDLDRGGARDFSEHLADAGLVEAAKTAGDARHEPTRVGARREVSPSSEYGEGAACRPLRRNPAEADGGSVCATR